MHDLVLKTTLKITLAALLILAATTACAAPSPTPTPISEATPTATPEPTVTPTPEATATPVKAATPTNTPLPPPTATPTPSPTAISEATPTPVPPLTWETLKNTAYPNEWPKDGVAQLEDGVYREKYLPDSATEMVISLADIHTFGDLNGDGVDDVLAILISYPGGSGTFFYLMAVLNQAGTPNPVATAFLGDRTIIRSMSIESGQIALEMTTQGPDDPMCCPNMDRRQTYALRDDSLILLEQVDTPRTEPAIPRAVEPERIEFPAGVTSIALEGSILPIGDKRYMLHGHAGQTLSLAVTSPHDHVLLSVYGSDGAVLVSVRDETTSWTGELPRTLDYMITLVSIAGSETTYTLQVDRSLPPTPTPGPTATPVSEATPTATPLPPTPTPAPEATPTPKRVGTIYLTFDDGPVDPQWTPQVLEALAPYDAKATFFVLGALAERFPELIEDQVEAGHAVANHTFDHHTLDGIGREAFFNEIQKTEEILGEKAVKCLRPPYGATDAYTRTYLAELGYELVLWNIDTEDWRQPGAEAIASAVVDQAHPGAIVLFHDGGGDRSQTVEALGTILETLSSQGYVFEVVCP